VRGLQPLPAWQAETQMRELQPLPAWQAEKQLRELQPLPAWQAERQLRGLQPVSAWQAEKQLRDVQAETKRRSITVDIREVIRNRRAPSVLAGSRRAARFDIAWRRVPTTQTSHPFRLTPC
jgi:hypothetical protein